jgi:FixJ family two-component response regulator
VILPGASHVVTLTPTQRQIAALVAAGFTSRQIAPRIGWRSWRAVDKEIARIGVEIPGYGKPRLRIALWWERNALAERPKP